MLSFRCARCGADHAGVPLVWGPNAPSILRPIPQGECRNRVSLTDDDCIIDRTTYLVRGCLDLPIRGADEVFEHCQRKLGVGHKQTTSDGLFSLEQVECIGACSWAPAAQVNYDFHQNLTVEKMDKVLEEYRRKGTQ